jgi:hypothetical protein
MRENYPEMQRIWPHIITKKRNEIAHKTRFIGEKKNSRQLIDFAINVCKLKINHNNIH